MKYSIEITTNTKGIPLPIDEQETTLNHIVSLICQGYNSGEVHLDKRNSEEKVTGWWTLVITEQ